jgi:uncharacterized ion transporter superfamily protein YfcC
MNRKYILRTILAILVIGVGVWYAITYMQTSVKNDSQTTETQQPYSENMNKEEMDMKANPDMKH